VNATVLRLVWRVRPPQDPHTHMTLMKRAFKLGRGLSVARQHAECLTPQLLQKLARALDLAPTGDLRGCIARPGGGGGGGGGGGDGISAEGHVLLDARATAAVWARQLAGVRATQRCNKLRIVTVGISGRRSLTGPLRDGRRFPSTRVYPVPGATRATTGFGIRPSFKGHFLSRRAKPVALRFATFASLYATRPPLCRPARGGKALTHHLEGSIG
jgi:hypothetical protein